jgi:hypothetical protein
MPLNTNTHPSQFSLPKSTLGLKDALQHIKWLSRYDLTSQQYNEFISNRKKSEEDEFISCNTDKVACTACDSKCKTRGVILIITNCGVILSYREIFGSESLTQVTM